MAADKAKLMANLSTLKPHEMRTLNRYHLHPADQRCCAKCLKIYDGIRQNFHIKKHYPDGSIGWNNSCRTCNNARLAALKERQRQNPHIYISRTLHTFRHRAANNNIPFNLTADALIKQWDTQNGMCFYTEQPIDFTHTVKAKNTAHPKMASLDRMDPIKGYTIGNVVWCAHRINTMKNDHSYDEFIAMCSHISKTRRKHDEVL